MRQLTDLVEYFIGRFWQCHRLLENLSDSVEALALGPVIEGPRNVDLLGIVRPRRSGSSQRLARRHGKMRPSTWRRNPGKGKR
jgi:hypothetical protein